MWCCFGGHGTGRWWGLPGGIKAHTEGYSPISSPVVLSVLCNMWIACGLTSCIHCRSLSCHNGLKFSLKLELLLSCSYHTSGHSNTKRTNPGFWISWLWPEDHRKITYSGSSWKSWGSASSSYSAAASLPAKTSSLGGTTTWEQKRQTAAAPCRQRWASHFWTVISQQPYNTAEGAEHEEEEWKQVRWALVSQGWEIANAYLADNLLAWLWMNFYIRLSRVKTSPNCG